VGFGFEIVQPTFELQRQTISEVEGIGERKIDKPLQVLGDISTRNAGWTNTATIFLVPSSIRQPTLVTITWQGGDRYEYAGVRLD
jgi:hypothetical protein